MAEAISLLLALRQFARFVAVASLLRLPAILNVGVLVLLVVVLLPLAVAVIVVPSFNLKLTLLPTVRLARLVIVTVAVAVEPLLTPNWSECSACNLFKVSLTNKFL